LRLERTSAKQIGQGGLLLVKQLDMSTVELTNLSADQGGPHRLTTVLVAEDDPMSRQILQRSLHSWGFKVVAVHDGVQALESVGAGDGPELLLLDWMMPEMDGLELCRRIRALEKPVYPYIVLLTARDAKQDLVTAFEAGADDYLTKPFHVEELRARLRAGTRILTLQRDLIGAREQLRFQANHDSLTGVWNRRAIMDLLAEELERARRNHQPLGVMMIDLDHFKSINDRFGHAAGDVVLREVAARLVASVRSYDRVGRYGGEEFLVLLSNASLEEMTRRARRVCEMVAERPILCEGHELSVTASIGGTAMGEDTPIVQSRLLRFADIALYRAKERGRNRVETCDYQP
jgi:two-component system cell cycle response regulator